MSPWTLIGWMLAGVIGFIIAVVVIAICVALWVKVFPYFYVLKCHLQTRKIPPEAGQIWIQDGTHLCIEQIADNGRIVIRCRNSGWSDSPEGWESRVKSRKLYLVRPAKRT